MFKHLKNTGREHSLTKHQVATLTSYQNGELYSRSPEELTRQSTRQLCYITFSVFLLRPDPCVVIRSAFYIFVVNVLVFMGLIFLIITYIHIAHKTSVLHDVYIGKFAVV